MYHVTDWMLLIRSTYPIAEIIIGNHHKFTTCRPLSQPFFPGLWQAVCYLNSKFASFALFWQFVCQRIKEQNNVWHNFLRLSAMQAKVNKYQCSSTLFSLSLSRHTTFITTYPSVWPYIRAIASMPAAKIIHFVEDLFLQRLKVENQ